MKRLIRPTAIAIAALVLTQALARTATAQSSERSTLSRDMDKIPTLTWRTPERSLVRDPSTGKPLAIIEGPSGIVGNDYIVRDPDTGRVRAKISP